MYKTRQSTPRKIGLYEPRNEVDSCGVGFIADIKGRASRKVVSDANKLLVRMTHRGAKQGEDGDGAGLMVAIPHRFFKKLAHTGQLPFMNLPPLGRYGVGQIFLPNGLEYESRRAHLMDLIESVVKSYGLKVLGWRILPSKSTILGPNGRATEPYIVQLFVTRPCDAEVDDDLWDIQQNVESSIYDDFEVAEPLAPLIDNFYDPESSFSAFDFSLDQQHKDDGYPRDFERLLYLVRRKLRHSTDMYICSFSSRVVVYKGQLQSEQLFSYFDDLMDEDFMSYLAIVHSRFSTNTYPTWDRAHPFRCTCHNGEINTIHGNRKWLLAREGNATVPPILGTKLKKDEFLPFEEAAFVTRFHTPDFPRLPTTKSSSKLTPCDSTSRLVDSLAIPTDIVSAHPGSLITNSREMDMEDPVIEEQEENESPSSDSSSLDGVIELFMMTGRDLAEAVMLIIPEAIQKGDPQWRRDFAKFNSCLMEPWDGPALISFTDGLQLGAQLDRNGLRPGRYAILKDGRLIFASEVGVVDVQPSMILKKGCLTPGKMLLIDFHEQRIVSDEELRRKYATKHPYGEWLSRYSVQLKDFALLMTDAELRRELQLSAEENQVCSEALPSCVNEGKRERGCSEIGFVDVRERGCSEIGFVDVRERGGSEVGFVDVPEIKSIIYNDDIDITSQLIMFGYSFEKVELLLAPMAKYASEPVGSMGNDTPLACLSSLPKIFTDYFQQTFAQGTNPSIDGIREGDVMSLACPIGKQGDVFSISHDHAKRIFLDEPVLSPAEFKALITLPGYPTVSIDLSRPMRHGPLDLGGTLEEIQQEAEKAVRSGCRLLILSDRRAGPDRYPIWSSLAVGAVHLHLLGQRLRMDCGIVVETGEASDVHQIAFLLSCGADALYPYLAYQALSKIRFFPNELPLPLERLMENYISAIRLGLLRVMSKVGVCTMLSYKGGCFFQPLGVDQSVLRFCFDDKASSAIGGIGFQILSEDLFRLHSIAYPLRPLPGLVHGVPPRQLPDSGDYRFVSIQGAELHANHPDTINYLQSAVDRNDFETFRQFSDIQNALADEIELRGQLEIVYGTQRMIPLKEVEPAKEIVKRLVTGAISFGAVSEEAFTTIAKGMNMIGSRSTAGEGGEIDDNDRSIKNKTKQVTSGRFGVTSFFLSECEEIQIKCGQGAKPGEGGELPGYKVHGKVATIRRSTPGVGLISPPPHHDMYSIEDVSQLVRDLKHGNPRARISIKLVSKLGVGVIAAGCVKAKCDHLLIAGASGATGAGKLSSFKRSGLPWELGLAETHQTLCLNGLREKVILQVDGQLKTGRDVVFAALLGAEEFGFATQPLIAMGCQMTRKCHLDACPTGIATQDPELRKRFRGKPEHVANYFFMVAEEIRMYMARMGFCQFSQMIGRSDLLRPRANVKEHWKKNTLDFSQLLIPGWILSSPLDKWRSGGLTQLPRPMHCRTAHDHELDKVLDLELIRRARRSLENQLATVSQFPIRNVDRSVGGLLSYEVSTRYGQKGLATNTITVNFRGSAGQSFGCWLAPGVTFRLSGDCNDYVGKGLSGGIIAVKPPLDSPFFTQSDRNIIIGNAALYGATSGSAFFAGVAAERFAVRNSGAIAVAEGCGDYGCEYMTRGVVVILGEVGRNFGTGMSGGIAYVLDLDPRKVNLQTIELQPVVQYGAKDRGLFSVDRRSGDSLIEQQSTDGMKKNRDAKTLENLLIEHYHNTRSSVAQTILANLPEYFPRFTKAFPKDMKRVLKQAIQDYVAHGSQDALAILDDWEAMTSHKYEGFHLQSLPYTLAEYADKFEPRRNQLRRLRVLDVADSALKVLLGHSEEPSALRQHAAELERTGRLHDLLSEENSEQFTQLMHMIRFVYAHWRSGNGKDLRRGDTELVKRLLPSILTPSRRRVLKAFLLEEKRLLEEHLKALEGCKLAEDLLASSTPIPHIPYSPSTVPTMTGEQEWDEYFGDKTPQSNIVSYVESLVDIESPIKEPRLSHFRYRGHLDEPVEQIKPAITQVVEQKPFLVQNPDPLLGFLLYSKQKQAIKTAANRVLDWEEVSLPVNTRSRLYQSLQKTQAARCMGCGTPTCNYPNTEGGGCPLGNRIPTWNGLVVEGQWKLALERLLDTNNFPEFTGRVCPAPCEDACFLTLKDQSVAIKSIELMIIEKGFQESWIQPAPPKFRSGMSVAIIGSGPSGLSAAQMLNRAGHCVSIYEKSDRIGGLLMYGIPNMKLDKKVVQRRVDLLRAEGIQFKPKICVGENIKLTEMLDEYHAVLMAVGTQQQTELEIPGRHLEGVVQGLEFLKRSQKSLLDSDLSDNYAIDAVGKRVIVIGSGDMATDCVATAVRMGCSEVIQFLETTKKEAEAANGCQADWHGKSRMFKIEYGQEEAIVMQGIEPREFGVRPIEFVHAQNDPKRVGGVKAIRVHPTYNIPIKVNAVNCIDSNSPVQVMRTQSTSKDIQGTERVYPADLVLIGLDGGRVDVQLWEDDIEIPLKTNGMIKAEVNDYCTGIQGLFACGDCRTGASLVVSAIAEGRDAARVIDDYLRSTEVTEKQRWLNHGQTIRPRSNLPSVLPVWTNPLRVYHETKQLEAQ